MTTTDIVPGIREVLESNAIQWKPDAQGLSYLRGGGKVRNLWQREWPQDVQEPIWSRVGRSQQGNAGCWEWLLVTSYDHPEEMMTDLPAGPGETRISELMDLAKRAFRAPESADWMHGYYDYAVRLMVRGFLTSQKSCGRMVFTFSTASTAESQWRGVLNEAHSHLGITGRAPVERRIYHLFHDV